MGFGEAIGSVFSKYATFRGRARRSEYWYFVLFNILISILASIIDAFIAPDARNGPAGSLVSLALLLPSLAVTVRRFHDTNRSGYWLLGFYVYVLAGVIAAIAMGVAGVFAPAGASETGAGTIAALALLLLGGLAYAVWCFILTVLDGMPGENAYGPDPKGPNVEIFN